MARQRALTFWAIHDDGHHRRFTVPDTTLHPAGLFVGSDPSNHVVLDDSSIEGFHACMHVPDLRIEVIAGPAWDAAGNLVDPGTSIHGLPIRLGAWTLGPAPDPQNGTISIWRDALLEQRQSDADAMLEAHGIARLVVAARPTPPVLVALEVRAMLRVLDPEQPTVHDLGRWSDREFRFTVGGEPSCDVVLHQVPGCVATFEVDRRSGHVRIDAARGHVEILGAPRRDDVTYLRGRARLSNRWAPLRIGDEVVVQLCRWPMREELVRR